MIRTYNKAALAKSICLVFIEYTTRKLPYCWELGIEHQKYYQLFEAYSVWVASIKPKTFRHADEPIEVTIMIGIANLPRVIKPFNVI